MPLDKKTTNTRKGRPGVRHSEIVGRAMNYRGLFWSHRLDGRKKEQKEWVRDKPYTWAMELVAAKTTDEVSHALESAPSYARNEFKALIPLILKVLQERAFPKTQKAQFDFLADSLAAYGRVSPRRSPIYAARNAQKNILNLGTRLLEKSSTLNVLAGTRDPPSTTPAVNAERQSPFR